MTQSGHSRRAMLIPAITEAVDLDVATDFE
jgi:hypothetical protein